MSASERDNLFKKPTCNRAMKYVVKVPKRENSKRGWKQRRCASCHLGGESATICRRQDDPDHRIYCRRAATEMRAAGERCRGEAGGGPEYEYPDIDRVDIYTLAIDPITPTTLYAVTEDGRVDQWRQL